MYSIWLTRPCGTIRVQSKILSWAARSVGRDWTSRLSTVHWFWGRHCSRWKSNLGLPFPGVSETANSTSTGCSYCSCKTGQDRLHHWHKRTALQQAVKGQYQLLRVDAAADGKRRTDRLSIIHRDQPAQRIVIRAQDRFHRYGGHDYFAPGPGHPQNAVNSSGWPWALRPGAVAGGSG